MNYLDTLEFANQLDQQDPLRNLRDEFLIPKHNGHDAVYLCGNSLGLQPRSAKKHIHDQLNAWEDNAVEGWFMGNEPWLNYHKQLLSPLAKYWELRKPK
jgi:kynureninase